jgi:acetylornithine deacetylase
MNGSTNAAAPARYSTAEMLDRLVSFDTTSRNSNLPLIDFVRGYLDAHEVPYRLAFDETGEKASLHAIVGPREPGGLALSGHVDTVPVEGQAWTGDPFALRRQSGPEGERLVARGTADMKGFVAAALAAVPDLKARGLARPAHLLITYDEETTCNGARRLIEDLQESGLRPDLCLVGEPSGMKPILAHKGRMAMRVRVRGVPGHSSQPAYGVNAIQAAARAIAHIDAEARRFAAEGPFVEGFDPPHTTVHVGTFQGGSILNIIPEEAAFTMEWRTVPGDDFFAEVDRLRAHVAATIEPEMHAVAPESGFTFEEIAWIPALALPADHKLAAEVRHLTGSNSAGAVSYGTEGGLYQDAGIATIICGPGHVAQAHRPDEWVALSELDACDAFIRRLAERMLL